MTAFNPNYQEKKEARINRLLERAEKKEAFAANNDLSLYGEAKSGIPLGQPILVGHHSEHRHRRHLERLENKVRKGYEAAKEAENLRERAFGASSRKAIDSDNPEALELLTAKIEKLKANHEKNKLVNSLVRKSKGDAQSLALFLESSSLDLKQDLLKLANDLLTPDFLGRVGIPDYTLKNASAEIRRLETRLENLQNLRDSGFEKISSVTDFGVIEAELIDGQIRVSFPFKPCEETRTKLKSHPISLKWSSYSVAWVRKFTPSCGQYFRQELEKAMNEAKP